LVTLGVIFYGYFLMEYGCLQYSVFSGLLVFLRFTQRII
jgi:hypothetical protein